MIYDFFILMRSELAITVMIFLLLFVKLGKGLRNETLLAITGFLLAINILLLFAGEQEGRLFAGMFVTTPLISMQKAILLTAVFLITLLNYDWLKNSRHLAEFYILLLSALLGMFLMISSGNLLIFYLSLELATIPVAAMANFDLEKKKSSEAAMKMILSSAFSSGILLFGISLLYGATGTIQFSDLPNAVASTSPLQVMAFVFVVTAFAFKLSVVPFHLWTADVYEGAPVPVASFLSVVSKGSVAFIFISAVFKFFQPMGQVTHGLLSILAILTLLVGNLFAVRQQNIKRFLAFSSISQVGFILVGIMAGSAVGTTAVVYFVLIYVFSNLAAFGVVNVIAGATGRETIDEYRGLYRYNKFLSWMLTLSLFSLAGIPPTAGFFGKLFLIMAGATTAKIWFIVLVVLNLVISLYYYLRVVRAIFMDNPEEAPVGISTSAPARAGLILCSAGILLVGLIGWIYEYLHSLV